MTNHTPDPGPPTSGATWQQDGPLSWTDIKQLPRARPQFVAQRIQALRAFLNDQPDAYQLLDESGAQRPHTMQFAGGAEGPCTCPYCENRPVEWAGNAITPATFRKAT